MAVVAVWTFVRLDLAPYDDALFFLRFADNAVEHGVFAWNPDDGPVYGNTAQLWQLLVAGLRLAFADHMVLAGRLMSAVALVTAGLLLPRRHAPATLLAFASPVALATVVSGMETAVALALGAAFLRALAGERDNSLLLTILAVLLWLARPDSLLLSLPSLVLAERRRWRALALSVAAVGVGMGLLHLAYGTPVPLSFLVKSGLSPLTDPHFLSISRMGKLRHSAMFLVTAGPLLWMAGGRRTARWWGPALLFCIWHLTMTVDVMGLHARFYAPALPWLALAAASGDRRCGVGPVVAVAGLVALGLSADLLPGNRGWAIGRVGGWTWGAAVATVGLATLPHIPRRTAAIVGVLLAGVLLDHGAVPNTRLSDRAYVARLQKQATSWRGLSQLARCLGPELHVYHSEIGVVGARLPEARVTDLGGLMNAEQTLHGLDFEAACQRDRPEAIFLPHRNYRALNAEIADGECIRDYVRVVEKGSSPLHVRRDLAADFACAPRL